MIPLMTLWAAVMSRQSWRHSQQQPASLVRMWEPFWRPKRPTLALLVLGSNPMTVTIQLCEEEGRSTAVVTN